MKLYLLYIGRRINVVSQAPALGERFSPFVESEMKEIQQSQHVAARKNAPTGGGKQERRLILVRGEGKQERSRHQIWWGGEQQDSNVILRNAWKNVVGV
ncbi:hypothetical protein TNCV_114241 [Trichonephila clavipes]|nr:hypothetical protein TNCV_114241 [Trichonephila clavipes]